MEYVLIVLGMILFAIQAYLSSEAKYRKICSSILNNEEYMGVIKQWLLDFADREQVPIKECDVLETHPTAWGVYSWGEYQNGDKFKYISLLRSQPKEERIITIMHELGHHYYITRFNDKTEESADKFIEEVLKLQPLWVQYGMEPWRRILCKNTERRFNRKEVALSYKNRRM